MSRYDPTAVSARQAPKPVTEAEAGAEVGSRSVAKRGSVAKLRGGAEDIAATASLLTQGALFQAVQLARVFPDSKTFPDCVVRGDPARVEAAFRDVVRHFVEHHFELPAPAGGGEHGERLDVSGEGRDAPRCAEVDVPRSAPSALTAYIASLWPALTRRPASVAHDDARSTLIGLPAPFVVPGGRFREIYYWDSYFTSLGLVRDGRLDLVEDMVRNFAWLIDRFGHVPNGNRRYLLGRSQPPMFGAMLQLLERARGTDAVMPYVPQLEREYRWWMARPADAPQAWRRTVAVGGTVLNRYWDDHDGPREESYAEDVDLLAHVAPSRRAELFRNLRAGAESGWDFSSRWLADEVGVWDVQAGHGGPRPPAGAVTVSGGHADAAMGLATIRCTYLLPVDLNSLLYDMEAQLGRWLFATAPGRARSYAAAAVARREALTRLCHDPAAGWWFDYDWRAAARSPHWTLAGAYPLAYGVADARHSEAMAANIEQRFLRPGGVVTTLRRSGQQWDSPNGWAPLQWVVATGLHAHGHDALAREVASRFVALVEREFRRTGKLMEKYDVCNPSQPVGGGEYPVQEGFGWTNGVVLDLIRRFGLAIS
ncbi:MAG: trehalase family glycosidase [Rhodocyclaceae bacterium]